MAHVSCSIHILCPHTEAFEVDVARGPLGVTRAGGSPSIRRPGPGTLDFALRSIRGGKHAFMEMAPLAIAHEPRVEQVVDAWRQLTPWQRRFVTLEDLATKAGLTPGEFLAAVVRASFEQGGPITDLIIASAFPRVVQATVKRALKPNGVEDRALLMEHMQSYVNRLPTASRGL